MSEFVSAVFQDIDPDTGAKAIVEVYTLNGSLTDKRAAKLARYAFPQYSDLSMTLERHDGLWGRK